MGKVRCGHCALIFDARATLHEEVGEPEGGRIGVELPNLSIPPAPDEWAPDTTAGEPVFLAHDLAEPAGAGAPQRPELGAAADQQSLAPKIEFAVAKPGAPVRKFSWAGPALLLFIVLAAQLLYHFRGEFALLFPQAKPQLAALCEALGCELPLPQRPQLMSIETSDLQADPANPGIMILSAALRNRAGFAQSLPALELTLTDAQDQPLARRVLWASDYLGRNTRTELGFAANTELGVRAYIEAAALKPTGYRLYLFFP